MYFELVEIPFKKGLVIVIPVWLYPHNSISKPKLFKAILDTGATSTHISEAFLNQMGYSSAKFTKDQSPSLSINGQYYADLCKAQQLNFCGVNFNKFTVKVWNPPTKHHVEGVIGMDLLSYFNISINMDTQKVIIKRSQSTNALAQKST